MANCRYIPTKAKSGKGDVGRSVIGSLLVTATFVGFYLLGWKIRQLKRKLREVTGNDSSGKDSSNRKSIQCAT